MSRERLGALICFDDEPLAAEKGPGLNMYIRLAGLPVDDARQTQFCRTLSELLRALEVVGWEVDIRRESFEMQAGGASPYASVIECRPPVTREPGTWWGAAAQYDETPEEIQLDGV